MILGRTDLRISVSGAKFDAESDFEVRLAVARQKPKQSNEKLILRSKIFVDKFFSTSKNEMSGIIRNTFSQSLRPNGAILGGKRPFENSIFLAPQNFERLKNREDSSDFDDFWTKLIASTLSNI